MSYAPSRALVIDAGSAGDAEPRVGGGALIGGVAPWPISPSGKPLVLVASLPATFLADNAGVDIGASRFASVFTTYAPGDYFLDEITYHGDPVELELLRRGATQVLVHDQGDLVHGPVEMPSRFIRADAADVKTASRIGGAPDLLQQNNDLDVEELRFALQIYGGELPFRDLFFLADGIGYLYLPTPRSSGVDRSGLFFVQVT